MEDSFTTEYPLLSRTYCVSSDNKGFYPHMFSNSIFDYCLDVTSDQGIRLDWCMAEEGGGWKVADCYILEQMRDVAAMRDVPLSWDGHRVDANVGQVFQSTLEGRQVATLVLCLRTCQTPAFIRHLLYKNSYSNIARNVVY